MEWNLDHLNPFGSFRPGQREVIEQLLDAFYSGEKVVELSAPTGSGKTLSLIVAGRALLEAKDAARVVYTTPLVTLVEQLRASSIYGVPCLVGKQNYTCAFWPHVSAADCPLSREEQRKQIACTSVCEYRQDLEAFRNAPYACTTLDRFMFDPSARAGVDIVMIDESAGLEDKLLKLCDIQIPEQVNTKNNFEESVRSWVIENEPRLEDLSSELKKYIRGIAGKKRLSDEQNQKLQKLTRATRALEQDIRRAELIANILAADQEYIIDNKRHFRLISASYLFEQFIAPFRMVVLASGTPTTALICSDFRRITAPHPIPVENRPIYYYPVGKMGAKDREETAPDMGAAIERIHARYHQLTIVHCNSYPVAEMLRLSINGGTKTYTQQRGQGKEGLEEWRKLDDCIFLSVALEEGVDLAEDKAKVNIIANVPYPYLGDEWVHARSERDGKAWYRYRTAVKTQQAMGRISRTVKKLGENWILDANFWPFWRQNSGIFEPWFNEALRPVPAGAV